MNKYKIIIVAVCSNAEHFTTSPSAKEHAPRAGPAAWGGHRTAAAWQRVGRQHITTALFRSSKIDCLKLKSKCIRETLNGLKQWWHSSCSWLRANYWMAGNASIPSSTQGSHT